MALPRSQPGAWLPTAADQLRPGHPLRPHRHSHLVGAHGPHLLLPRGQVSAPPLKGKGPSWAPTLRPTEKEPRSCGNWGPGLRWPTAWCVFGHRYWRFNEDTQRGDPGYPKPISVWQGIPASPKGAFLSNDAGTRGSPSQSAQTHIPPPPHTGTGPA